MCFAMGCASGRYIPFCHRSAPLAYRLGSVMHLMVVGTPLGDACLDAVLYAQHVLSVLPIGGMWHICYQTWDDGVRCSPRIIRR
jgi:hypothetical protein